jgi:uncharacterized membrane protein
MTRKKYLTPKTMALLALFSAIVAVATWAIHIPIPATSGILNFGDTIIFIAAGLLGPISAMIAGAVGSALGDVLSGAAQFAPWTFVIKGIEGLIAGLLVKAIRSDLKAGRGTILYFLSFLVAGLWMVAGYFGAEYVIFGLDWAPPIGELPFNLVQAGISAVIGGILTPVLVRTLGDTLGQ